MRLLKLQYNFVLTNKVKVFSGILIVLTWIVLLLQSGLLDNEANLIYNTDAYVTSFMYDGFNIIKIVSILFSMLLSIYVFYINNYDVFIVTRTSKQKVIISKIFCVLYLDVLFVLFIFICYAIIWSILDYSLTMVELWNFCRHLILLTMYYSVCYILLLVIFSNIFSAIIPFIGYLISNFSIDYGTQISDIEKGSFFLHVIFPDLVLINREVYYLYSPLIVTAIASFLGCLIIIKYKVDDTVI